MKATKKVVKTILTLEQTILAMVAGMTAAMTNVKKSTLSDRKIKVTVMRLLLTNVNKLHTQYGVTVVKAHPYFTAELDKQGLGSYSLFKKYRTLINAPDELAKYLAGERDLNPAKSEDPTGDKSTDEIIKSVNKKLANIKKFVAEKLPDYTVTDFTVTKIEKTPRQPRRTNETVAVFN